MDTELVNSLIEVLNNEAALYKGILKIAKNKTDVIIGGKVSELENIVKLEQYIILQLSKLEEEREELVDKLSVQLSVDASDITLSSLEKLLPKEQAERLESCHKMLPEIVRDLDQANVLNSKLIKNSLDYIDFSINVLMNAGSAGSTYGNSGQSNDLKKRNLLDMKL